MKHFDYAGYLDRHLEVPKSSDPPPLPEHEKHPKRADYDSYEAHAAEVYRRYGLHGSLGALDVVGAYRRQIQLGCDLLQGAWPSTVVSCLVNSLPLISPIHVEAAEQAWIKHWKFWTKWGWFSYGGIAVLTVMCGGEGTLMEVLNVFFWVFVFWPCIIFTVVGLLVRWRVGWPILLVNLWLLTYIVKWILKVVLLICGAVLVWRWIEGLNKK
jgi:hypothetical protein